jgi:lipopolysaccharide/colanic/teichoic acid biosynthesis glycosyltransferase
MKRIFDICLSLLSLIILSPVLLIVALIVIIDDGFPVVFKQERVGKDNKLFKVRKFRTMKNGTRNAATSRPY